MNRPILLSSLLFKLVLLAQITFSRDTVPPFPEAVIVQMATRQMRYHHFLWHQVRENWNNFNNATQEAFTAIGWAPPNPARSFDPITGAVSIVLDNFSGEDFLYMHRQMIATANALIAELAPSYGNIQGWTTLPAPGDPDYPVPPEYTIPNQGGETALTNNKKGDSFYDSSIVPYEAMWKDPDTLRSMNLSELGARMEVTIHAYLHVRFSEESPIGYRSSYNGTIPEVDPYWDNVTYNWLADTYSSQACPLFWKIHGWIDDRIEDWRVANNLSSITWQGTWVGGPMENLSSVLDEKMTFTTAMRGPAMMQPASGPSTSVDGVGDVMQKALEIFLNSGVKESSPFDDVIIPPK